MAFQHARPTQGSSSAGISPEIARRARPATERGCRSSQATAVGSHAALRRGSTRSALLHGDGFVVPDVSLSAAQHTPIASESSRHATASMESLRSTVLTTTSESRRRTTSRDGAAFRSAIASAPATNQGSVSAYGIRRAEYRFEAFVRRKVINARRPPPRQNAAQAPAAIGSRSRSRTSG